MSHQSAEETKLAATKQELQAAEQKLQAAKQELQAAKQELQAAKQELQAAEQKLEAAEASKNERRIASASAILSSATDGVVTAQKGVAYSTDGVVTAHKVVAYWSNLLYSSAASVGPGRKRKSLPPPVSGSGWTRELLPKLDIHILRADEKSVFRTGGMPAEMKLQVSENAKSVIQSCSFIDMNSITSLCLPAPRANPGFALFKYLRLIAGESKLGLESVVDDLVIHLLTALGFNDDYFVVLSKNNLKFSMHGDNNVTATADVTVYDINSKFRLAVIEDKVEPDKLREDKDTQDAEAQLVAEAIAAAQSNLDVQEEQRKRQRASSEGHISDLTGEDSVPVSPGPLFLIRVLGQRFSFYSTHLSTSFLKFMRDYEDQDKQKMQIVYQLERPVISTSTASSTATSMQVHFLFAVPRDREFIIYVLDSMLQILRISASASPPQ